MILRWLPLNGELLQVDNLVSLHDFLDEFASLLVVHRPNLLDALVIGLFEPFKSLLELNELVGEEFIFPGIGRIQGLGLSLLVAELDVLVTVFLLVSLELGPKALLLLIEDCLALVEHIVVEGELLLIQLIDSLHILHALFEDLHFRFKLDLLLSLLVSILAHGALKVSSVIILLLLPLVEVVLFDVAVLLEELLDLDLVTFKDITAFTIKLGFDVLQLGSIAFTHCNELILHLSDQRVDVLGHLCDSLDIVAIFLVDLGLKLLNQVLLISDDLGAGGFLSFNVLANTRVRVSIRISESLRFKIKVKLTSASSLQSSFSSSSCQFQSISTFFLCDWMTSF